MGYPTVNLVKHSRHLYTLELPQHEGHNIILYTIRIDTGFLKPKTTTIHRGQGLGEVVAVIAYRHVYLHGKESKKRDFLFMKGILGIKKHFQGVTNGHIYGFKTHTFSDDLDLVCDQDYAILALFTRKTWTTSPVRARIQFWPAATDPRSPHCLLLGDGRTPTPLFDQALLGQMVLQDTREQRRRSSSAAAAASS